MIFRSQGHPQKLLGCFFHRPLGLLIIKLEAPGILTLPADNLPLMIIFHDGNNGSCPLLDATIKQSIGHILCHPIDCFIKLDYLPEQIIDLIRL